MTGREVRAAFADAAAWFVETTALVEDRWAGHGLGEWTVLDLVGHTLRALLTVETYLDAGADRVEVTSPADYFVRVLARSDPAAVAQRGREAGAALGGDPAAAAATQVHQVVQRVAAAPDETPVGTPVGGMRLVDYLPTRTFELVVHTCDLAVALDVRPDPPEFAAASAGRVVAELAAATGRAADLLLATTGRRPLPSGWSLLG